jgi:RNA polymerase sigma-70 factor (ECF subfamily)
MHSPVALDRTIVARLHAQANADRWGVTPDAFQAALESSAARGLPAGARGAGDVERYLTGLHMEDLALACACAMGQDAAWDYFVREFRPVLYRAASAIDSTGNARELADSLYADLFGLGTGAGPRQSLFRYFHGRSSLATWLRAVLSQRHVDRVRAAQRLEPLPVEDVLPGRPAVAGDPADRLRFLRLVRQLLALGVAALAPRDRLRLASYYAQDLTLADIGRLLGEHEATVSRQLARTRRTIRDSVERQLRDAHGLSEAAIRDGFDSLIQDSGSLDLADVLRKIDAPERSTR